MAYRVILTPRAAEDANSLADYIMQSSPQAAARWFSGLVDAVLSLVEMPHRCAMAVEAETLGIEIRQHLYGKRGRAYRIVFRIYEYAPNNGVVRVLTIRHYAQSRLTAQDVR